METGRSVSTEHDSDNEFLIRVHSSVNPRNQPSTFCQSNNPPFVDQYNANLIILDQCINHQKSNTNITPILGESDSRNGWPTPRPIRQSIANPVPICQSTTNPPIYDQSINPMPILDQSANPSPIRLSNANFVPIHHQFANPSPIHQSNANPGLISQSITTNLPIETGDQLVSNLGTSLL